MKYPHVLGERETLAAIAQESISRFGDGELRLAVDGACSSQQADKKLAAELRTILAEPKNCLVGIPNAKAGPRIVQWARYTEAPYDALFKAKRYGSAFITRPDSAPSIDTPDYWDAVRDLWRGKDVVLVVGDTKSITPEMLSEAASVRVVNGPRQNAYAEIGRIEEEIGTPSGTVILCLGAAATVLAYRLAQKGVHALDLGHMGMFMRHAGAYLTPPEKLASPAYRLQLRLKHGSVNWGKSGHSHAPEVLAFAEELGARTVLDYGCGRGTLAASVPTLKVIEYDPGIAGKDGLPKPADMVVSTDVLEHIEPELLDGVLAHQYRLAGKGAYLVISLRLAREILADGRNAHLVVKPADWWLEKLGAVGWKIQRAESRKGLCVWLVK